MSILHICNTFFDLELSENSFPALQKAFDLHEVFLQLQFLPFLYALPSDGVLVTFSPENEFWKRLGTLTNKAPRLHLITEKDFSAYDKLNVWGHSPTIFQWAKKNRISYQMPEWAAIKMVNSKAFSFEACPLPGGKLIHNEKELETWLKTIKGEAVLKTCFGTAGRGHLLFNEINIEKLKQFAEKEWTLNRPVIGETWMQRLLDFSTQWEISHTKEIRFIGETLCKNDSKGRYQQNSVGYPAQLFGTYIKKVEEQKQFVQKVLSKIANLGYFGNVGIDAMLYEDAAGSVKLHPIVEINARKTMGWAAIEIRKKHFPEKEMQLAFTKKEEAGILPSFGLRQDGSKVKFSRVISII